jgi:LacI family repressor for deo operon, udp, cdd, tsx, nupC, and nupG
MADVAREAGVSIATVSRTLRNLPGVGRKTRDRVLTIAESLSYVVSPEASRLSGGTTGRVALVVPTINLWFFSTMLAGIERVLREADIDVLLYHVDGAEDRRSFFERLPARRKADAVVVITLPVPEQEASRLDMMGVFVVAAGGRLLDYPCVRIDDKEAAHQAVSHLVHLGHRRIAMIRASDPEGLLWAADLARSRGYLDTLEMAGLEFDENYMVTEPFSIEGGARAMERLLSLREPPTAVFAYSDEIAMAALRTLRRAHIPVPSQMSIVAVDDHPMSVLHDLTTVHQPVEAQGELAGHMVLDLLHGRELTDRDVLLPTHLVVRGSTAPPPGPTGGTSPVGTAGTAQATRTIP